MVRWGKVWWVLFNNLAEVILLTREDACFRVWRQYREAKAIDDVARMGIRMCGTGRVQPRTRVMRRIRWWAVRVLEGCLAKLGVVRLETDGGHTLGVLVLAHLVHKYFPEFLPREVWILVNEAAIYHELGEVRNGDIVDDGTQNEREKNGAEAKVVGEFFREVPDADYLREIIVRSEELKRVPYEEVSRGDFMELVAWLLKALDKMEAVMQNGRYSADGVVGHIGQKDGASAQDMAAVEELGTDDIVFVWAWNSAGYLRGTVLWEIMVAMMVDIYSRDGVPPQFLASDF